MVYLVEAADRPQAASDIIIPQLQLMMRRLWQIITVPSAILGLIFGALVLNIWSADTSILKGLLGLGWTALLLIGIFFAEKNEKS